MKATSQRCSSGTGSNVTEASTSADPGERGFPIVCAFSVGCNVTCFTGDEDGEGYEEEGGTSGPKWLSINSYRYLYIYIIVLIYKKGAFLERREKRN
jgi:hypothetical protein